MHNQLKQSKSELEKRDLLGRIKSIKEMTYIGAIITEKKKEANLWEAMASADDITYGDYTNKEKIVEERLKKIITTKFKKDGKLEEEIFTDTEGNLIEKFMHKYDSQTNIKTEISINKDGKETSRMDYIYDQNGNLMKENEYRADGSVSVVREYSYKFDHNGNIMERTAFRGGEKIDGDKYKYEENGNIINEFYTYDEDGEIDYTSITIKNKNGKDIEDEMGTTYEYDNKGNIVEECHKGDAYIAGRTRSYSYEYDAIGNWVTRIERSNEITYDYVQGVNINIPYNDVEITKREIEYYGSTKNIWKIFSRK